MDRMGRIFVLLTPILTFPHQGFTGVGIENNRACGWDFTPILTFPHQGGRDFERHLQPF